MSQDILEHNMLRTTILLTIVMGALLLWRNIYPHTCISLVIPLFFATIICLGRFDVMMHRRRYWASYYLNKSSTLYRLVTGRTLSIIRSIIVGTVYTFSLSTFTVLGETLEMAMLFLNILLVLILHPIVLLYTQRLAAAGVADYATTRLLTLSSFAITALIYIAILLNTPIPGYINPLSLDQSLDAASTQMASVCPLINTFLKGAQEFTATQWFYMVSSTNNLESNWLKYISWIVFLGYSSLALMGMSLLSAEVNRLYLKNFRIL